ncbi:MAG: YqaA family protein [Nanoarchaeota archaeon]|nr:YqaA family protein [Nanoarchaeota archaeon]
MSLTQGLIDWTKDIFLPLGPVGLFMLAFMESSFFPIPPDILLIILVLADPSNAMWLALICTAGSVLGGMFGYSLGFYLGKPFLEKFVKENKVKKVHRLFERYEAWAIFIAGFSPIPYKVFTIAGGVFYIDFKKFVIASILSRGLRFFIIAGFLMFFGEMIVAFIEQYFGLVTIGIVLLLILGYYGYKRMKKKGQLDFLD